MPETTVTEQLNEAISAVNRYGQAVLKPLFSTKARGMKVLSANMGSQELTQQLADFKARNPLLYLQKKYDLAGEDYGLVFLGESYLCAYSRQGAKDSWNTTINSGGKYQSHQPPPDIIRLADRARALFNLDYTTVDVAVTPEGPVVFEVSAFGGFRGVSEGAGLDPADLYAAYVLKRMGFEP
jgi:ribosomal protein S6--L-glutamate ligase